MLGYRIKIFTYKDFKEKQEELVNIIYNIESSYNATTQTYTENIAKEVQLKKNNLVSELTNNFNLNNKCFYCILLVEEKPVAYCICKELEDNHWEFLKTISAMDMQNKGYEYILEKNCITQIKINNGKTIK